MNTGAELYLDTARLGRMKKSAQWAVRDFARLAGEAALTLYGTNFFLHGFEALSEHQQRRCPRLSTWAGIEQLKRNLLRYVEAGAEQECVLASRSLALIRLGAQLMSHRCQRVLIPDLLWRPYESAVRTIIESSGGQVHRLNLRREIFTHRESDDDITRRFALAYVATRCDGVCLPAVTHDGVRLPVDRIIETLRSAAATSFVMVDAAQALGQVPSELGINRAEFVVAGVHKWVGAGMPLGVGIGSRKVVDELCQIGGDDPLLALTVPNGFAKATETANIWPLISCNAVVADPTSSRIRVKDALATRLTNRRMLLQTVRGRDWVANLTHPSLRAGILLLSHSSGRRHRSKDSADAWRSHFQKLGIALSSYPGSLIRLSLPAKRMSAHELAQLASSL